MSRIVRIIYRLLSLMFFALGCIGTVVPLLPTTPFLLLAAFFATRSSQKLSNWMCSTKLYQKHLASFVVNRSMTKTTKIRILALFSTLMIVAFIVSKNTHARIFIAFLVVVKYYYFGFHIATAPEEGKTIPSGIEE